MTSKDTRARAALFGIGLAVAFSTAAPGVRAQPSKSGAAPPPVVSEELKAARELFQEAYKDEQEKRYAQALEKFQRVAAVKESASVRYRIASVLESLGRLRDGRDAFRALAASKPNLPVPEQEIADSAADRAHQLDKKIPKLILKLQDSPPADTRVAVDGAPVPLSTTARRVEVDPGDHVVQASSPTSRSTESKVTLAEGAEVEVTVVLQPLGPPPPPPPVVTPHRNNTLAYVALGAGGVLLVTGIIVLVVREGDVSDLTKSCPNGTCPVSRMSDLQSKHDQAQLFGPLGVGLGLVGLAGIGIGGYLLFRPTPPEAQSAQSRANGTTTSTPKASGVRIRVGPRPVTGGALLGLSAAF